MKRDWANLDSLALNLILEKSIEPTYHIWFGSVCKNWHSVSKLNHHYNIQFRSNMLPMLMIPSEKSAEKRKLYSVVANRVYPFELTMLNKKRCCGSSYGWLATVDADNIITWVTLSVDPITSPDDYVVAAIYTNRGVLAFIKAGQEVWTYIQENDHFGFIDITFYKGLVYAVDRWKKIVSFELCYSSDPHDIFGRERRNPNVVLETSEDEIYSPLTYLVKSLEGELWMVRRFITREEDNINKGTKNFHVFKLVLDDKGEKLIHLLKLESLGDNILFVGDGDSTSISASYFSNSLQKDLIYYSDNYFDDEPNPYPEGPFDLGIYNVKWESFDLHCHYKSYFKAMSPPIWVVPPFQLD
ncbi:uncharacterized protein LOC127123324 [Lathyrus oleraceus]|uniref:KIB1-4 beta-propeller domain-containing protein n=1 Tax=Pisum sativum TaxID=3888 RepID=A0A9D4YDJ1_PEA|nr:uncharacterized protein LOC127123324 [Pisum sativum]KAI5437621.1 hypothetical protein KIW84_023653 [Pisum sativum]